MSWIPQTAHAPASNGIPALLAAKRREILTEHLFHDGDIRKKFVSPSSIYELWHRTEIQHIFPRWTSSDRDRLLRLHIISFTILVFIGWPVDRETFRSIFLRNSHVDSSLPFSRDQLTGLSAEFLELFVDRQYTFLPCIIRRSRRAVVDRMNVNQPWPFVDDPKQIGYGGFGDVWQAKIAKGCYRNESDQDSMVNVDTKIVAYKHFRDGRDYHKEVQSLDYLRESLINHDHIAVHLAAIVHGKSDFYIFFELTKLGDLEVLLNGGEDANLYDSLAPGTPRYDFNQTFPQVRKVNFVEELANIASALEYLHETLARTTTLGVYCAHMDLRPKNILVYPRNTGSPNVGKWVLADFGISSFKHREPGERSLDFRTMGDFALDTSQTGPHNLQGSHRAPELHELSDRKRYPGRKCDIWSFGCIANEVLAFLLGGLGEVGVESAAQALREFRRQKSQGYFDDYWFEHETPSRAVSKAILRTKVDAWLSTAPQAIIQEEPGHADWIRLFVQLLYKTLNIMPEKRPLASEVGVDLRDIIRLMDEASDSQPWASPDLDTGVDDDPTFTVQEQASRTIEEIFDTHIDFNVPLRSPTEDELYSSSPPRAPVPFRRRESSAVGPLGDFRSDAETYGSSLPARIPENLSINATLRTPSRDSSHGPPPTASTGQYDSYGTSPGSAGPLSPLVTRLRSAQRDGSADNAVTSSGSERGSAQSSDRWSMSTGPRQVTPRSQSPSSMAGRHSHPAVRLGKPEQYWSFSAPSDIKVFEIGPAGDIAAFIHRIGSDYKLSTLNLVNPNAGIETLDYVDMPTTIQWDRLSVTSRYIIAAGKVNQRREGRMIDLQERRQISHPSGWTWPAYPCTRMTPSSRGAFAWTDSTHSIQIWDPQEPDPTPIIKHINQDIDHICFNTTGTCLFVWAREGRMHFVYTINMLDPHASPPHTRFEAKLVRQSNKTSIWAAQSDHACLVEEASSLPRWYIRSDEDSLAPPQEISETSSGVDSSSTALCDNWLATAKVTGLYSKKLRVSKRYFSVNERGRFGYVAGETVLSSDTIRVKDKASFRLAAYEDSHADRVVVCTQNGGVWRWESPPNERLRQRHGSFLREGMRR